MAQRVRERGNSETLPSGAVRVRVYAGIDPVTKRPHYLRAVVPPGPKQASEVRKVRNRLVSQVEDRRNPRTNATLSQLLERYLDQFDGAPKTLRNYRTYVRRHVEPFLGHIKVGSLDADMLDSFYAECRRCQDHCDGRPSVRHRTDRPHVCDDRCGLHKCEPLSATTIRHIHHLLSGAYKRALRWQWVTVSPMSQAEPPAAPKPNPQPPTAEQAARIVNEAWRDPDWGTLVWTAMTTGMRRGEICALRWHDLDLDPQRAVAWVRRAVSEDASGQWAERDTKTHQQRRVALDRETLDLLTEHHERARGRAAALGFQLADDAFVFSATPGAARFLVPTSVTQRYQRLASRLKIDTTLHKLRHYSATELILAGVDVRTVGGRLGHAGGGTTTLRVYAAFVSEADQRAAGTLSGRMPGRPTWTSPEERAKEDPQAPYERIAAQVRRTILAGELPAGAPAPTEKELAGDHKVSAGTAHRAMMLLRTWGLVGPAGRGHRPVVLVPTVVAREPATEIAATADPGPTGREMLDLEVIHRGSTVRKVRAEADPNSAADLRRLLVDAARRNGSDESEIGEYELNVRYAGERGLITTFVTTAEG